jgi:hypothetical protein
MRAVPIAEILDANQVLAILIAFKKGDFSVRLPVNQVGLAGKIADVLNDIFELNENMANEFRRVSKAVGKEGRIGQRAFLKSRLGTVDGLRGIGQQPHFGSGAAFDRDRPRYWSRRVASRQALRTT